MLIKRVEIRRFQSHVHTNVDFSRYLNAIIGTSRSGKSALLRAIFQVFNNEIAWDACITWDSDNTHIKLIGNDHTIERIKGKNENSYIIDGVREDFVGNKTPEKIAQITNIAEHNLQRQDDIFFMIDLKPGPLSKAINEVSGLSIIDASIKEATQRIRDIQADVRFRNIRMLNLQSSIAELEFIVNADKEYSEIESIQSVVQETVVEFNELSVLWNKYKQTKNRINTTKIIKSETITELELLSNNIVRDTHELQTISKAVSSIAELTNKTKLHKSIDTAECNSILDQLTKDYNELKYIRIYTQALKIAMIEKRTRKERIEQYKKELNQVNICPTCLRPL